MLTYQGVTFNRSVSFKNHFDINMIKCKTCLEAMKTMVVSNMEQRLLSLLFQPSSSPSYLL